MRPGAAQTSHAAVQAHVARNHARTHRLPSPWPCPATLPRRLCFSVSAEMPSLRPNENAGLPSAAGLARLAGYWPGPGTS